MSIFGWSLPPGCGTLPGEEDEQLDNRIFAEAFPEASGPAELARQYYKYNASGPAVGITISYMDEQAGVDIHGEPYAMLKTRSVYGSALDKLGAWKDMDDLGVLVEAFQVGCVVEGVDYDCETIHVPIDQLEDEAITIAHKLNEAVAAVCEQAHEIWMSTHGCSGCHELNGGENEDGYVTVHPDCPECGGFGVVI